MCIRDRALGYYLVDSSLGALCALTTTNPDATVIEKNSNPSLVKTVEEGETWNTKNDANIGDTVKFKATITVQGVANDYVMHDEMSDGLSFDAVKDVTVTKNNTAVANAGNADYELVTTDLEDGCDFEVRFTSSSVSYTHLDVYKRQALYLRARHRKRCGIL